MFPILFCLFDRCKDTQKMRENRQECIGKSTAARSLLANFRPQTVFIGDERTDTDDERTAIGDECADVGDGYSLESVV